MKSYQQYINGEFRDAVSKEQFEVINPFTEKVVAMAPKGNAEDAALALEAASAAQKAWAAKPCSERAVFLTKMADAIRANRVMLAETLAEEQAKVMPLAQVEIDATAAYFDYYAGCPTSTRARSSRATGPPRTSSCTASPSAWSSASARGTSRSSSWPARSPHPS